MENASDALKMAFAIFVFIMALSIALALITMARNTSDTVLMHSDKALYQEPTAYTGALNDGARIVGIETVISTLYELKRAKFNVCIDDKAGKHYEISSASSLETLQDYILELKKNSNNTNAKFSERIVRVTTSGKYKKLQDGTKIKIADEGDTSAGSTSIYIFYKAIN